MYHFDRDSKFGGCLPYDLMRNTLQFGHPLPVLMGLDSGVE